MYPPTLTKVLIALWATSSAQAKDDKQPLSDVRRSLLINATHSENRKPAKIGQLHEILISTDRRKSQIVPTVSDDGTTETFVLTHQDASYLSVHFKTMDLPEQCQLEITETSHLFDKAVFTKKGFHDLETFWGTHVAGDSMDIIVTCNDTMVEDSGASFVIDQYVAGNPVTQLAASGRDLAQDGERANLRNQLSKHRAMGVCKKDDKKNAVCYEESHANHYLRARAVARLFIKGEYACTGWLVSESPSLLITNQHCIASQRDVDDTDFEFMDEEPTCDSTPANCKNCDRGEIFRGKRLLVVDKKKDFALIQLEGDPAKKYGYLHLDPREIRENEVIYIPQHPDGRPKELAITDTDEDNKVCRILEHYRESVAYKCDTEGGSSGSPVLSAESHKVIALHHMGGACMGNLGVPVAEFYDDIKQHLGAGGDACPNGSTLFELIVETDEYPEENTWTLEYGDCSDKAGEPVEETLAFDSLHDRHTTVSFERCLPDDCYKFTIYDVYADGMCCEYGDGGYTLLVGGEELASAKQFGSEESTTFGEASVGATSVVDIYHNDFENGRDRSYSLGRKYAGRRRIRDAPSGKNVITLESNKGDESSITVDSLPVSPYAATAVKFWFRTLDFENGDSFVVEYSNNGKNWETAGIKVMPDEFDNGDWYEQSYDIATNDMETLVVRFRCDANSNRKKVDLDDFLFTGIVAPVSSGGSWSQIAISDLEDTTDDDKWGIFKSEGASFLYKNKKKDEKAIVIRQESSVFTDPMDVSTYEKLVVDFMYKTHNFSRRDSFFLEYSADKGKSWVVVQDWSEVDDWEEVNSENEIEINDVDSIQIRFRCESETRKNMVFLDNIEISGWN